MKRSLNAIRPCANARELPERPETRWPSESHHDNPAPRVCPEEISDPLICDRDPSTSGCSERWIRVNLSGPVGPAVAPHLWHALHEEERGRVAPALKLYDSPDNRSRGRGRTETALHGRTRWALSCLRCRGGYRGHSERKDSASLREGEGFWLALPQSE